MKKFNALYEQILNEAKWTKDFTRLKMTVDDYQQYPYDLRKVEKNKAYLYSDSLDRDVEVYLTDLKKDRKLCSYDSLRRNGRYIIDGTLYKYTGKENGVYSFNDCASEETIIAFPLNELRTKVIGKVSKNERR